MWANVLGFAASAWTLSFSQQKHTGRRTASKNVWYPCFVHHPSQLSSFKSQESRTSQVRILALKAIWAPVCLSLWRRVDDDLRNCISSLYFHLCNWLSGTCFVTLCWAVASIQINAPASARRVSLSGPKKEPHKSFTRLNRPAQSLPKQQICIRKGDSSRVSLLQVRNPAPVLWLSWILIHAGGLIRVADAPVSHAPINYPSHIQHDKFTKTTLSEVIWLARDWPVSAESK